MVPVRRMSQNTTPASTHDHRILIVLSKINENIRRPLEIRDLAIAVNLSPGRLAHLFKSEIGLSPQRYLNQIRLEKAKELLEMGLLSVKEIGADVGFPSVSSFCRSFKAANGMTPKEYRLTRYAEISRAA
jgi:AraC family transcriptional regulator, arabinose operon regulatory protein